MKPKYLIFSCALVLSTSAAFAQLAPTKKFLVCGDSKVLLVDYARSKDSIPEIAWSWDAQKATDLPDNYRSEMFNTIDDCKAVNKGRQIMVSSSGGAIAIVNMADKK